MSGILTQVKSLVSTLLVNVVWHLSSQTLFLQENQKCNAENAPNSMSETKRMRNLQDQLSTVIQ